MADNTHDNNLDNPNEHQQVNPSIEITSTTNTKTNILNQETKIMEVHHHAHDPAAPHHKKNWKNYFWEFLMLFLAVFCGFLAEYQLEHKIERDREKQYIKSMVDELKTNSNRLETTINQNKRQLEGMDSLLQNIYHPPYNDSTLRTLYYLKQTYSSVYYILRSSKGTISQLKNSGGFRLIRNRAAVDSIYSYEFLTDRIETQGEAVIRVNEKLMDISYKIYDNGLTYNLDKANLILTSNNKFKLITTEEKIIKEYANIATTRKGVIRNYTRQLTTLQNRIPGIIEFLEKEYDLK